MRPTPETLRKGWCPGALRPMATGDGLLVRVRPRAGAFSLAALKVIARTAANFGSGEIDLTNRANLQLRGLCDATYPDAIAALSDAGLLDQNADIEAVRNVIVDPLCGLDPDRADMRPLAVALERRLADDVRLLALPGKFGFSIGGTAHAFAGRPAVDIAISATHPGHCAFQLDGDGACLAAVKLADSVDAVQRLALAFLSIKGEHGAVHRMRDAVALIGSDAIFSRAGLATERVAVASIAVSVYSRSGLLGAKDAPFAVAIGLPFGRIAASELGGLCDTALQLGCSEVRPSQFRTLIFPVHTPTSAAALLAAARQANLLVCDRDARMTMDVCPGAPSCNNATTNTRADAQHLVTALAALGTAMPSVHISGCEKGCARRASAQLTFIARNGVYDLITNGAVDGPVIMAGIARDQLANAAATLLSERTP